MGAGERWKQGDLADSALVGASQRWWAMIQVLLQLRPSTERLHPNTSKTYDVSPDDQRFVMFRFGEPDEGDAELILVEKWFEELKRLVPN